MFRNKAIKQAIVITLTMILGVSLLNIFANPNDQDSRANGTYKSSNDADNEDGEDNSDSYPNIDLPEVTDIPGQFPEMSMPEFPDIADPGVYQVEVSEVEVSEPEGIKPMVDNIVDLQNDIAAAPTDGTPTNITLTGNITLGNALTIDENRHIILDGNGFTITQNTTGQRHFLVGTALSANIGTLTLQNITLTGAGGAGNRGGIEVSDGSYLTVSDAIIEHNQMAAGGGINSSGHVNLLTGAIVRNNEATGHGGGVHTSASDAETHMHSGSLISQNVALHGGGVGGMGLLVMHGGEISFNRADANGAGGGVFSWTSRDGDPAFIMHGGTIEGNLAQVGGGIAFLGTSVATAGENAITGIIHDGEIINNGRMFGFADTVQGGGIFLQGWARLTIHDGTINGNYASGGGGGIMASSGANPTENPPITTLNIIDGLIDDNSSGASGGGIMLNSSTTNAGSSIATLGANVVVSNNTAPAGSGAGIAFAGITDINTTMLTINGSTIQGNTAGADGGGIAIWAAPRQAFNMPSGSVLKNTAENGGGIFAENLPSVSIGSTVTFSCNVATDGAVRPPNTLPANIAATSSTIFDHPLNNLDINLDGTMILNLAVRFYPVPTVILRHPMQGMRMLSGRFQ